MEYKIFFIIFLRWKINPNLSIAVGYHSTSNANHICVYRSCYQNIIYKQEKMQNGCMCVHKKLLRVCFTNVYFLRMNDKDIVHRVWINFDKIVDIDRTWKLVSFTTIFPFLQWIFEGNALQMKCIFLFYVPYKDDINWSMMLFCWKLCHFKAMIVYFLQKYSIYVF